MGVVIDIKTRRKIEDTPAIMFCPVCMNYSFIARVVVRTDMSVAEVGGCLTCMKCRHTFSPEKVME